MPSTKWHELQVELSLFQEVAQPFPDFIWSHSEVQILRKVPEHHSRQMADSMEQGLVMSTEQGLVMSTGQGLVMSTGQGLVMSTEQGLVMSWLISFLFSQRMRRWHGMLAGTLEHQVILAVRLQHRRSQCPFELTLV